jgi:hypothetical protein
MSNTDQISLQNPDEISNRSNSVSSSADTPVVNPASGTKNTYKNRAQSIDIPKWNNFQDYNNEVPTMDYSPMYVKNSPNIYSRKGTPQNLTSQTPIRIGRHNDISKKNTPKGLIIKICEFLFGSDDEYD